MARKGEEFLSPPPDNLRYPRVQTTHHRVRYGETDRMGVVYYAHYFAWFEAGRADYMREIGANYRDLEEKRGVLLAVAEASAKYRAGAEYDDLVRITTWLAEANRARLRFCYEVHRERDEQLLATGETTLVSVTKGGRARMVPRDLLRLIPTEPGPRSGSEPAKDLS